MSWADGALGLTRPQIIALLLGGGVTLFLLTFLVMSLWRRWQKRGQEPDGSSTGTPLFTLRDVQEEEYRYLTARRQFARRQTDPQKDTSHTADPAFEIGESPDEARPVGLALSGGGIRSATTCLGVLQRLASLGVLPTVDYLSTVSGGGYIGATLSSLLSRGDRAPETAAREGGRETEGQGASASWKSYGIDGAAEGDPKPHFDTGRRFPFDPQVRPERDPTDPLDPSAVLAHLRQHGDFLARHRSPIHRDVLRTGGVLASSVLYHLTLFALVLLFLAAPFLMLTEGLIGSAAALGELSFDQYLASLLFWSPGVGLGGWLPYLGIGALVVIVLVPWMRWYWTLPSYWFLQPHKSLEDSRQYLSLVTASLVLGLATVGVPVAIRALGGEGPRIALLAVPPVVALGAVLAILVASLWVRSLEYGRNVRSRVNAFQGLTLWIFTVSFGLTLLAWAPAWIVSNATLLTGTLTGWLGSLGLGRLLLRSGEEGGRLPAVLHKAAVSTFAAVLVLVGFVLACCALLLAQGASAFKPLVFFAGSWAAVTGLLVILGCLVDANRMAFHYFYRDRLAEAFLQTSGAVPASEAASSGPGFGTAQWSMAGHRSRRPMELLRDDADMPLSHLHGIPGEVIEEDSPGATLFGMPPVRRWYPEGAKVAEGPTESTPTLPPSGSGDGTQPSTSGSGGDDSGTGGSPMPPPDAATAAPYHLLVTALNLTHTRDLALRSRRAAPFIFSKRFCGSHETGFVDTRHYRDNRTSLATAMTLSAAAASTAMGARTFFGQSFLMTLFGIRLGLWLRNPGYKEGQDAGRTEGWPFWPWYLLREMLGLTDARGRLIHLSDGNHTGDNLGLVPLLERRCRLIVAVDAEMDPDHDFGSLAEALRQAEVDHSIVEYDLDLDPLRLPPGSTGGESQRHVAIGIVQYPRDDDREAEDAGEGDGEGHGGGGLPARADRGWLVVIKNSITGDEPEPVVTYRRQNPAFPHESTVDQFFSEAQQESYRHLGWHMVDSELPDALWRLLLTAEPGDDWREKVRKALEPESKPGPEPEDLYPTWF